MGLCSGKSLVARKFIDMKHFKIQGTLRTELGKKATKAIRKGENIPCVIYGGEKNINFTLHFLQLENLFILRSNASRHQC